MEDCGLDRGRNRSVSLLFQTACRMIIFRILTQRRIIIRGLLRCGAIIQYFHIGTQGSCRLSLITLILPSLYSSVHDKTIACALTQQLEGGKMKNWPEKKKKKEYNVEWHYCGLGGGTSQPAAMTSYLCAGRYPAQYLSPHLPLALEEKLAALNIT